LNLALGSILEWMQGFAILFTQDLICALLGISGKENNGFDPNIQLVPGGSWAGSGAKPAAVPPGTAAPTGAPGAPGVRPTGAPTPPGLGGHTFSGGWGSGSGSSNSVAAPPAATAQQSRQEARVKMDFPELGAAPEPVAPPPVQSRPGTGDRDRFFDRPATGSNGVISSTAGWRASGTDDTLGARKRDALGSRKLDNDWAEDDEGGMDFSKPIVIKQGDEAAVATTAPTAGATLSAPLDPREEAKMLAMKKQAQLEKMEEDMINQARNREKHAQESAKLQSQQREEEQRVQMEERAKGMEARRKEQQEAAMKHRAETDARRAEDLVRREEDAKKREEAAKVREEEHEKKRAAEKELLENQKQYMTESVQAAKQRRQEEEDKRRDAERARAAEKLAELDRKAAERKTIADAERAKRDAENPPAPVPQQAAPPQQLARAGMGSMLQQRAEQPRPAPRSSPWNNHAAETPDPEAERVQWANLRKEDRVPAQGSRPAENRVYNQPLAGARGGGGGFGRGGGIAPKDRPPYAERGGAGGPRQLYDHKNDRLVMDDAGPGSLRKQMEEREVRDAKMKEKNAAKDAARKEAKEQAEKEAAAGPSREELKKLALEERRKREADRRAREQHAPAEDVQNSDSQRAFKGKVLPRGRVQGNSAQQGAASDVVKRTEAAQDTMAMPISNDFFYASGPPAQPAWTAGTNFAAEMWSSEAGKQSDLGRMQFQQGRSPEKGDEGDRRKMQDTNDVAASTADFILSNDDHSPDKMDGMATAVAPHVRSAGGSFPSSGWQPQTGSSGGLPGAGWNSMPSSTTWDGNSVFAGHGGFALGLLPSLNIASQNQVWDNSLGVGGQEGFNSSQWAAANVTGTWSAQPQTSLQLDAFKQGAAGNSNTDKPLHAPGKNKQQGGQAAKGKQQRESKPARGGHKGGGNKKDNQADASVSCKADVSSSSAELATIGGQPGAGRGAGRGARGGHSAPNSARHKQQRGPKIDGEASGTGDIKAMGRGRGPKPLLLSQDIKQRAAAVFMAKEAANSNA